MPAKISGRGRPPFEPTPERRERVADYCKRGASVEVIARAIGTSAPTLRKHFGDELTGKPRKVAATSAAVRKRNERRRVRDGELSWPLIGGAQSVRHMLINLGYLHDGEAFDPELDDADFDRALEELQELFNDIISDRIVFSLSHRDATAPADGARLAGDSHTGEGSDDVEGHGEI